MSFADYSAQVAAGGATAPASASIGASGTVAADLTGGFARSAIPSTLEQLRSSGLANYTMTGLAPASINDGGLQINMASGSNLSFAAHTDAGAGQSFVMWMQTLAVAASNPGTIFMDVAANASGAGADAETGILNFSMTATGSGALGERADIKAEATGGAHATANFGSVSLNVNSTGIGAGASVIDARAHLGDGERDPLNYGLHSRADGAGSVSDVNVTGSVSLVANGDDAYAFISGIVAEGSAGGVAGVDVGDLGLSSAARRGHTYLFMQSSTDGAGSAADIHVAGNISLNSVGSEEALSRLAMHSLSTGTMQVDGDISMSASGPIATPMMQLLALGQGQIAQDPLNDVNFSVDGSAAGRGWLDIFTDHAGGMTLGDLNVSVATAFSEASVHVQHANAVASGGAVDATFLAHGDSTAPVSIGNANLSGAGDVHMFLNTTAFGTINQASTLNLLDLSYQLADQNLTLGTAPMTTVNGFSAAHDAVVFNGQAATAANFTNAGGFTTLAAMDAAVNAALDGTHRYVFAVYNGTEDINRNGAADDSGSGVLALDSDGAGVTAVLMLPGTTSLTPTDLA